MFILSRGYQLTQLSYTVAVVHLDTIFFNNRSTLPNLSPYAFFGEIKLNCSISLVFDICDVPRRGNVAGTLCKHYPRVTSLAHLN